MSTTRDDNPQLKPDVNVPEITPTHSLSAQQLENIIPPISQIKLSEWESSTETSSATTTKHSDTIQLLGTAELEGLITHLEEQRVTEDANSPIMVNSLIRIGMAFHTLHNYEKAI